MERGRTDKILYKKSFLGRILVWNLVEMCVLLDRRGTPPILNFPLKAPMDLLHVTTQEGSGNESLW